jgi:hypothetical protein
MCAVFGEYTRDPISTRREQIFFLGSITRSFAMRLAFWPLIFVTHASCSKMASRWTIDWYLAATSLPSAQAALLLASGGSGRDMGGR